MFGILVATNIGDSTALLPDKRIIVESPMLYPFIYMSGTYNLSLFVGGVNPCSPSFQYLLKNSKESFYKSECKVEEILLDGDNPQHRGIISILLTFYLEKRNYLMEKRN